MLAGRGLPRVRRRQRPAGRPAYRIGLFDRLEQGRRARQAYGQVRAHPPRRRRCLPAGQPGNLIGWRKPLNSVVVLSRGTTLQTAQNAMLTPTPRLGTLQAIASSLEPEDTPTLPSPNEPLGSH